MNNRARRVGTAAAAVALAAIVTPAAAPPLFDGLAFPDEPYRYVNPPANYRHTKPPTSAATDQTLPAHSGDEAYFASAEQGPQVFVLLAATAIRAPSGATTAHVRADPLAPTEEPPDGQIWGNVYKLAVTSDAGPATISFDELSFLVLRAPSGPPPLPTIEYDAGAGWRDLHTRRVGNDIYESEVPGAGRYAVVITNSKVRPSSSSSPTPRAPASSGLPSTVTTALPPALPPASRSTGTGNVLTVVGSMLAALLVAILSVRLARARRRRPPGN